MSNTQRGKLLNEGCFTRGPFLGTHWTSVAFAVSLLVGCFLLIALVGVELW